MKGFLVILLAVGMLIPLAVQAEEIKVEAQPVQIDESDTAAEEYGEVGAVATAGWPAFTYFWGSYNYEYVMKREQLIMGLEFATNALPLGFNMYAWIDFEGPAAATYFGGDKNEPRISNLNDWSGDFDFDWPLNSYGFLPVDWIDIEFEYSIGSFNKDKVKVGPKFHWMNIPALKGLKDALDSLGYPGGATLTTAWYLLRTDGTGDSNNWSQISSFYKIPFNIAGVDCFTQAWIDIDISNPDGQYGIADHQGHGTLSFQNTVGVNVWSHLWLWWELKDECFNYWSTGPWSNKNIVWDNSIGGSWQVLF